MSRYLRSAAVAALTLAASVAVAGAASAQTYNRLVVFGDSLSDNGNLFATIGQPASPPYFQGRFSNGPVFTELLGFNALRVTSGAPVTGSINYARGGARTENIAGIPPGVRNQLVSYQASGGVFGANDLVSIQGGANNIFQQILAFSLLPPGSPGLANPTGFVGPTAVAAATDINFAVNAIATAGAGTILVSNIPRLGTTPQFRGTAGAPLADFAGSTFNSTLASQLAVTAAARPGSNIILLDVFKVSDVIAANPGAFGFTNVTQKCLVGAAVCATPDTYLYWDDVHPTAAGHRLFARLANDYLYYGDIGAQSTVQGEEAFRQHEDLLDMAGETLSNRSAWEEGTSLFATALYDTSESDARGVVGASESDGYGGRVGIDGVLSSSWRMGVAASFRDSEVDAGALSFDHRAYGIDAWVGWRSGDLFVNGTVAAGIDQFDDIARVSSLGPITQTGETDGGSIGARIQAGTWFDLGGIALSPRVALTGVSTEVNGYREFGSAATYAYSDRTLEAVNAEVSLRAEANAGGFGIFVEGGYRDTVSDNNDAVRVGIAENPAQVLSRDIEEPFGGSVLASAGIEGDLGPVKVTLSYRGRYGDNADSHLGGLTLTIPLQ